MYGFEAMTFNIHGGYLEAIVRGHRAGLLTAADYNNLCQCESLDDIKMHLSATEYGPYLQNGAFFFFFSLSFGPDRCLLTLYCFVLIAPLYAMLRSLRLKLRCELWAFDLYVLISSNVIKFDSFFFFWDLFYCQLRPISCTNPAGLFLSWLHYWTWTLERNRTDDGGFA